MRREFFQEIEIPHGVEIELDGDIIKVKGKNGETQKKFKTRKFKVEKMENKILIGTKEATKKEKRLINTFRAHIKNMIEGIQNKFEYKMKAVYSHFPMTVEMHGNEITIKNFLGEKIPRKSKILPHVDVKISGDFIVIHSSNKEAAGQTAANLEKATWIRRKDRRVFQDGIFITSKAGEEI
ncbi:MAG: 50S ribosomal protein L6 [Nanoarchaeota archaeon]